MLHLMAFAVTIVLMVSFFGPANDHVGVTFAGVRVLAGGASYARMGRRAKRKTIESRKTFWARSLLIAFYVNVALVIWLVMTVDLALDIFREQLASLPSPWGSSVACGIVLVLLASYVLVSILPRLTAMILIACIAALYVVYSDNREIAGGLLRAARLGGGIPQAYYPPGAKVDAPPQLVCLILAIGESRIVWFPDKRSAMAPAPCASEGFKAHFAPKARQDTQDALKAAAGTRTLKREDFRGRQPYLRDPLAEKRDRFVKARIVQTRAWLSLCIGPRKVGKCGGSP